MYCSIKIHGFLGAKVHLYLRARNKTVDKFQIITIFVKYFLKLIFIDYTFLCYFVFMLGAKLCMFYFFLCGYNDLIMTLLCPSVQQSRNTVSALI